MQAAATSPPGVGEDASPEVRLALQYMDRLKARSPSLYHQPATQLQLAALHRRAGNDTESSRIYNVLMNSAGAIAWRQCARAEQWMMSRAGRAPRPVLQCAPTVVKPYLDGRLDDPLWLDAAVAEIRGSSSDQPASEVRLAFDDGYLYIGIRCLKTTAANNAHQVSKMRDADLSQSDRVEISLDIDRDYATHYSFVIDHRGVIRDACCNQTSWNPRWHIASAQSEHEWASEAAIPFAALGTHSAVPRQAWGILIERHLPNGQKQSWSHSPGNESDPMACGYLLLD